MFLLVLRQLVFLSCLLSLAKADSILFLYPIATRSETHLFLPIAQSLASKGHSITIVTPVDTKNLHPNISQIVPTTPLKDTDFGSTDDALEARKQSQSLLYFFTYDSTVLTDRCHTVYQNEQFRQLLTQKFDLVFMSGFFSECLEGVVAVLQVPYILMTSMPAPHWVTDRTGFRVPPSFIPMPFLDMPRDMDFGQRFTNTLFICLLTFLTNTFGAKDFVEIYISYLGNDVPEIGEIQQNLSLILTNTHVSINFARPNMPNMIEVGGIHCRPARALPKDLEEWIGSAEHGVIYFSLGTVLSTHTIPGSLNKIFLDTFSKLKEKVLWKWDSENMTGLPSNVKLAKWLPQQDVLGHPNVKLFISHGGLLSTQESVYHGVPILGLPNFVDQDTNTKETERMGFGLREEILEMTEESFGTKINRLLNEPRFTREAKKMSNIFKDQPETPLERATYWIEYVLRHKGAPHLKSAARNLNFIQYHSIDVLAFLVGGILLALASVGWMIYRLCCGKKKNKDPATVSMATKKKLN